MILDNYLFTVYVIWIVEVRYASNHIRKLVEDESFRKRKLGQNIKKFVFRIAQLSSAPHFESLRGIPGRFHELSADRKGQWACDLVGKDRLVFRPCVDAVTLDDNGQYIWAEIHCVEVLEIVDYH